MLETGGVHVTEWCQHVPSGSWAAEGSIYFMLHMDWWHRVTIPNNWSPPLPFSSHVSSSLKWPMMFLHSWCFCGEYLYWLNMFKVFIYFPVKIWIIFCVKFSTLIQFFFLGWIKQVTISRTVVRYISIIMVMVITTMTLWIAFYIITFQSFI